MDWLEVGKNIRKHRDKRRLSQPDLGKRINVSWEMISRYERGVSSPANKILEIANALEVPLSKLVDELSHEDSLNENKHDHKIKYFKRIPVNNSFINSQPETMITIPDWASVFKKPIFAISGSLIEDSEIEVPMTIIYISSGSKKYEIGEFVLIQKSSDSKLEIKRFMTNTKFVIGRVIGYSHIV